eukprot:TRINITY_DN1143_c0_g2_i1.p1 TRINITY_DN1143_c0_g2~~TRINITY_DN1143_c0_g2_i1.p1  ORF type:complete len:1737 (+),score=552.76 TRINITY_DN1143_c0_g2_i1:124-5334(+)
MPLNLPEGRIMARRMVPLVQGDPELIKTDGKRPRVTPSQVRRIAVPCTDSDTSSDESDVLAALVNAPPRPRESPKNAPDRVSLPSATGSRPTSGAKLQQSTPPMRLNRLHNAGAETPPSPGVKAPPQLPPCSATGSRQTPKSLSGRGRQGTPPIGPHATPGMLPLVQPPRSADSQTVPERASTLQRQAKVWAAADAAEAVAVFESLVRSAAEVASKVPTLICSPTPSSCGRRGTGGQSRMDEVRDILFRAVQMVACTALPELQSQTPTRDGSRPGSGGVFSGLTGKLDMSMSGVARTATSAAEKETRDVACQTTKFLTHSPSFSRAPGGGGGGGLLVDPRNTQEPQLSTPRAAGKPQGLEAPFSGSEVEAVTTTHLRPQGTKGPGWFGKPLELDGSLATNTDLGNQSPKGQSIMSGTNGPPRFRAGGSFRRGLMPAQSMGRLQMQQRRLSGIGNRPPLSPGGGLAAGGQEHVRSPSASNASSGFGMTLGGPVRVVASTHRAGAGGEGDEPAPAAAVLDSPRESPRDSPRSEGADADDDDTILGRQLSGPARAYSLGGTDGPRQQTAMTVDADDNAAAKGLATTPAGPLTQPAEQQQQMQFELRVDQVSRADEPEPTRRGSCFTLGKGDSPYSNQILPFGEVVIPDPFDDGEGMVRMPATDVHRYIGVFVLTDAGEICFWNPKMTAVTGISEEEAWGAPITSFLLHADEQEMMTEVIAAALDISQEEVCDYHMPIPTQKFSLACADGVNRCVVTLSMVRSIEPTGQYLMALCHERMPVEARMDCVVWSLGVLRRNIRRLEQVQGLVDLASNPEMKAVQDSLQKLQRVCDQQSTGARTWGKLSLNDLLGKLLTECKQEAAESGVSIQMGSVPYSIPEEVMTDVRKLPQVLSYLIHNAIRFNADGGKVFVNVLEEEWDEEAEGNSALVFEVRDTGCGMAQETLEALFDSDKRAVLDTCAMTPRSRAPDSPRRAPDSPRQSPRGSPSGDMLPPSAVRSVPSFRPRSSSAPAPGCPLPRIDSEFCEQAEPAPLHERTHTGTGFGLVMTSIIVQELGGTIEVESTVGQGTTFRVLVPLLAAEDTEILPQSPKAASGEPEVRIRCIIVQPNSVFRSALCHYLWGRKYAVTIAFSIEEVFADLEGCDLLVLSIDSIAEGREGLTDKEREELLDRLKLFPDVKVVLTSNVFSPEAEAAITGSGMLTLTSPLRPAEVGRVLDLVEQQVKEVRERKSQIAQVREAFEGGGIQRCPWERKRKLGTGSFGDVYEAINLVTQGRMAVKVMRIDEDNEQQAVELLNEVRVMSKLHHPNIIHYFHTERAYQDGEHKLLIFMEFASGGTLKDKIPPAGLPVQKVSAYTADVLTGLHYLHSKNIIHRDIKTANILIGVGAGGTEVCKLTDFGTAREVLPHGEQQLARSLKGTPIFMAPEVMNEIPYDWRADIWSVACLVMELVTGKPPWHHIAENPWGVVRYVSALKPDSDGFAGSFAGVDLGPYQYHTHVRSFLAECLRVDPKERQSCEQLLQHPLSNEFNLSVSNPKAVLSEAKRISQANRTGSVVVEATKARKFAKAAPARWGRSATMEASDMTDGDGGSDESNFSGWGGRSNASSGSDGSKTLDNKDGPASVRVVRGGGRPSMAGSMNASRVSVAGGGTLRQPSSGALRRASRQRGGRGMMRSNKPRHSRHDSENSVEDMARSLAELHESHRQSRRASGGLPGRQRSTKGTPDFGGGGGGPKRMSISGWG